jgi:hypothetical protein
VRLVAGGAGVVLQLLDEFEEGVGAFAGADGGGVLAEQGVVGGVGHDGFFGA